MILVLGNTQLIEVIQTAPGKFVTASGHSIKTSTAAGGVKTIIKAAPGSNAQVSKLVNELNLVLLRHGLLISFNILLPSAVTS